MFLTTLLIGSALVLAVFLILNAIVFVPAYHFGVLERFGGRTGKILYEGLGWKFPFIDKVQLISLELAEIDVDKEGVTFTTQDKLSLKIFGSIQYRPDPKVTDDPEHDRNEGKNVFISMSDEIIRSGIADVIKATLGAIGGTRDAKEFINNRQAIADLISSMLRLPNPFHLDHDSADPNRCGLTDCPYGRRKIESNELLEFYRVHWLQVKRILDEESGKTHERSSIEWRYGIDIITFVLEEVDFTDEVKKAFETDKQAEARLGAFAKKIRMARVAKRLGASAQVALNAADVALSPAMKKQVVSIEGEAGILGGILGFLTRDK